MKTTIAALALAAALALPASATTFPSLTTIYVAAGFADTNETATVVTCSNVSGQGAQLRILVIEGDGTARPEFWTVIAHSVTATVESHDVPSFSGAISNFGASPDGVLNIESTQSGVFCTAMLVDDDEPAALGVPLHLVRVNPHPGTVE